MMQARTPQVRINHEGCVSPLRTHVGEVYQGSGLALTCTTGNNGDGVVFRIIPVELDVGSQNPVGESLACLNMIPDGSISKGSEGIKKTLEENAGIVARICKPKATRTCIRW